MRLSGAGTPRSPMPDMTRADLLDGLDLWARLAQSKVERDLFAGAAAALREPSALDQPAPSADVEAMRAQFLGLISAYSEERWCAGWMDGIEESVRKDGGLWLFMAAACGGWPIGYRAEGGWAPLPEADRRAALATLKETTP